MSSSNARTTAMNIARKSVRNSANRLTPIRAPNGSNRSVPVANN